MCGVCACVGSVCAAERVQLSMWPRLLPTCRQTVGTQLAAKGSHYRKLEGVCE